MLTNDAFFNFARKHYDNPTCRTVSEFEEDLNRFKYLRKLLVRYNNGEDVSLRLILNHLMILFNVFEQDACITMMFFKIENEYHSILKTFLVGLNLMPEFIHDLDVDSKIIPLDTRIIKFMRDIYGPNPG